MIEDINNIVCSKIYIKEELDFLNVLEKLSKDKDWHVRACVALNKNCPLNMLEELSEDEKYIVRANVAENENCPEDILKKLSKDDWWIVKANIVENKNCSEIILKNLFEDKNIYVRNIAIKKYSEKILKLQQY